jgi:hypothetical protein
MRIEFWRVTLENLQGMVHGRKRKAVSLDVLARSWHSRRRAEYRAQQFPLSVL